MSEVKISDFGDASFRRLKSWGPFWPKLAKKKMLYCRSGVDVTVFQVYFIEPFWHVLEQKSRVWDLRFHESLFFDPKWVRSTTSAQTELPLVWGPYVTS